MNSSLRLRKDTLAELTSADLAAVGGGDAPAPSYGNGLVDCVTRKIGCYTAFYDCWYTLWCEA